MRRCGPDSPYGCNHHAEHVAAARRGWITRRAGVEFRSSQEHGAVRALLGRNVEHAHEHKSHAGFTLFRSGTDWFEVPTKVFKQYAKRGALLQGEEAERAARHKKEDEHARRVYEREVAKETRKAERERMQEQRQDEQNRIKAERDRERQQRQHEAQGAAQYHEVLRYIRASGGIRPNRARQDGSIPELEEWRDLPRSVRTRDKHGQALDDVATEVGHHFGLAIHDGESLAAYLKAQQRREVNTALVKRHRRIA